MTKKSPVRELTPTKRHILVPFFTSVMIASSATHVTIFVPSGVMATGPEICNGSMACAFLNLSKSKRSSEDT